MHDLYFCYTCISELSWKSILGARIAVDACTGKLRNDQKTKHSGTPSKGLSIVLTEFVSGCFASPDRHCTQVIPAAWTDRERCTNRYHIDQVLLGFSLN